MQVASLLAGFTMGAVGSLHCIGMCGPLSLSLPTYGMSNAKRFLSLLLYQAGRVFTYSVLGLLTGLAGRGVYTAGIQQWFSIITGVLVLSVTILYFLGKTNLTFHPFKRFYAVVQKYIVSILRSNLGMPGFVALGMANALLPCGMVYIAIATALSASSVESSVGFMAVFGTGTIPAMMLVAYSGQFFKPEIRILFRRLLPVFIMTIGIILILRGLNLGIPFISPHLPEGNAEVIVCPN